jgi:selenide,water dikinase
MSSPIPRLTSLTQGGGCACKLSSTELHEVLAVLPRRPDARLLYGDGMGDDAAIYDLGDGGTRIVQTVDFFPPIVDDPFAYGQIAAANALSDIYAVGARPITALNLVAFPRKALPLSVLEAVLAGGADRCAAAGCTVVGGHSIDDAEPKFGLAVTGLLGPGQPPVLNNGAKPGDALVLTKALGTGIVANAIKKELAPEAAVAEALASMIRLNDAASHAMRAAGATACTDVTGFGLLGHLHNLLAASGVSADLHTVAVPVLAGARALAEADHFPGGTRRNLEAAQAYTRFDPGVDARARLILADAQTSGGMLIAVPSARLPRLQAALREAGDFAARIGEVRDGGSEDAGRIRVR